MTVRDKGRDYHVVIVGSPTIPKYKLVGNKLYPNIVSDYRHTFARLKSLPCDVFLGAHGSYFDLQGKLARKAKGDTRNVFIDPNGYRQFIAAAERDFEKELKRQLKKSP